MHDLQFDNVDFVLYSNKVVDHFRTSIDDNIEFGCILYACKLLFQNNFQNSHVEFNRKQANEVAYELTKVAIYNTNSHLYSDVPSYICFILNNEMH